MSLDGAIPSVCDDELTLADANDRVWNQAELNFKAGDTAQLEKLLRGERKIPPTIRKVLAEFISGNLKIDRRGRGKHGVLSSDAVAEIDRVINGLRFAHKLFSSRGIAEISNEQAGADICDAGDVQRWTRSDMIANINALADRYGVTAAAIKKSATRSQEKRVRTKREFEERAAENFRKRREGQ